MTDGKASGGHDEAVAWLAAWWGVPTDEVARMAEGASRLTAPAIRKIERDLLDSLARAGLLRMTRQEDGSERIEVVPDAPAVVVRWYEVADEEAQQ